MVMQMKWVSKLWIGSSIIFFLWIFFLFFYPKLVYSKTVKVPDLVGLSEEEAATVLKQEGILFQITYLEHGEEEVLRTVPSSGVSIKKGYVVSVYIGKIFPKAYHSLLGQKLEDVTEELEQLQDEYGIRVEIEYKPTNNMITGVIMEESLQDGSVLKKGDVLRLSVAQNDAYFLMPNLVGMNVYDAIALMEEYRIKVKVNYYVAPVETDTILFQSIVEKTVILKGNPYELTLYVSKGFSVPMVSNPYELEELLVYLGFDTSLVFIDSNGEKDKLVAFEIKKVYDNNKLTYILWVSQ